MQVLFIKDLPGVGHKNQLKETSDGYAKNFLLPKGIAVLATDEVVRRFQNEQQQRDVKEKKLREKYVQIKSELDKRTFSIAVRVGDKGRIYGSVHPSDIIKKIKEKMNIECLKEQVIMTEHIKELGEYQIGIKLTANIIAHPKIKLINVEENEKKN